MSKKKNEIEIDGFNATVKNISRKLDKDNNEIGEVMIEPIGIPLNMINKVPVGRVIITIKKAQPPLFGADEDEE